MRYLLKYTDVDWISTEDPSNLLNTDGVIIPIRNTGGSFNVWGHLAGAKNAFPKLRMAQIESLELKKLAQLYAARVSFLLHLDLYWGFETKLPECLYCH